MTAIFLSAFAPGTKGGAQLCSLAFCQAICEIHDGNVAYIGPKPSDQLNLSIDRSKSVYVPERTTWNKFTRLFRLQFDRFSPFVDKKLNTVDVEDSVLYINGETLGRFAEHPRFRDCFKAILFHNHFRTYCKYQNKIVGHRRFLNRLIDGHISAGYHSADLRIFMSEEDRRKYRVQYGRSDLDEASTSHGYFAPQDQWNAEDFAGGVKPEFTEKNLLINTSLGAPQNESGIIRFLDDIWPLIQSRDQSVSLTLAGGVPTKKIIATAAQHQRVNVLENPTEQMMKEIWNQSPVAIATNEHGSGIKVRVGEALRRGSTVVSTPHCAIGYECISAGCLRKFVTPEEGCEAVLKALAVVSSEQQKVSCRQNFEENFAFEIGAKRLKNTLSGVRRSNQERVK